MRLARGFMLACAFAASAAWAQDLTGRWTATAVANNVAVTLDLKVAGNVVTGAILNPQSGAGARNASHREASAGDDRTAA